MRLLDDRAAHYLTDDVLVLFGDDFRYMDAFQYYQSLDNMIEYMNKNHGDKYFFRYSTPSDYVDAIARHDVAWPTKYDDLFPYSDNPDAYWTGYYTSRPNQKEYVRRASYNYHASAQLYAQKVLDQNADATAIEAVAQANWDMLDVIGIMQHHDAVAGTAKQAVVDDYNRIIAKGMAENNLQYNQAVYDRIRLTTGYEADADW